jgi:hypothetical protein
LHHTLGEQLFSARPHSSGKRDRAILSPDLHRQSVECICSIQLKLDALRKLGVQADFVRIGTRLAALEMIESGTTTYADMYYFEEEIAKARSSARPRNITMGAWVCVLIRPGRTI